MKNSQYQMLIIKEYVDMHDSKLREYLVDHGLLQKNGDVPADKRSQKRLYSWWLDAIHAKALHRDEFGLEASVEIGGHESITNQPIIFDFEYARMMPSKKTKVTFDLEGEIKKLQEVTRACNR
jgi:hypothetical protein|tara:strand:- start:1047 stop:1415 length:369 start_codon:yes stop_codon:yes gene_type:complete